jgi:hypothetical protein
MRYLQFVTFAAVGCLVGTALAYEPAPVKVSITSLLSLTGHSFLHLESFESNQIILVLSPSPVSSIRFAAQKVSINPGTMLDVDLGLLTFPQGQQTFYVVSRVFDGFQNLPVNLGPNLLEPLMVAADITKISYEDAFLSKRVAVPGASDSRNDMPSIDLGGGYTDHRGIGALAFNSSLVSVSGRAYNVGLDPIEMANHFPCLNADGFPTQGTSCTTNLRAAGEGTTFLGASKGTFGSTALPRETQSETQNSDLAVSATTESSRAASVTMEPRAVFGTVQGKFYLKLPGNTYQAAWGWVAKAWQQDPFFGFWRFCNWSYVGSDGSWSIPLSFPGLPFRVEYQPANRFVQLQDPSANVYTWGDNWDASVTDVGGRAADFTTNNLPGMDKLYVGATNEWVKFYNNGMNALRDTPIQVTFPNSLASGNCTSTDNTGATIAWSCSAWATGKIWIIPAHGDQSVVQHEIAHSINSWYWSGVLAPGSGGKHDLTNCFTNGVGLTEGFADFMPYWVQFDRTAASPTASYYNINIETIPSGTCNGQTAEMRVAATFWDTYDYWNDGPDATHFDSLYYTNQAAMVSLYLNNKKDTFAEYLGVMKSGQPAGVQTQFDNIYRLNTIIP